jgi:hypothetical protein
MACDACISVGATVLMEVFCFLKMEVLKARGDGVYGRSRVREGI